VRARSAVSPIEPGSSCGRWTNRSSATKNPVLPHAQHWRQKRRGGPCCQGVKSRREGRRHGTPMASGPVPMWVAGGPYGHPIIELGEFPDPGGRALAVRRPVLGWGQSAWAEPVRDLHGWAVGRGDPCLLRHRQVANGTAPTGHSFHADHGHWAMHFGGDPKT